MALFPPLSSIYPLPFLPLPLRSLQTNASLLTFYSTNPARVFFYTMDDCQDDVFVVFRDPLSLSSAVSGTSNNTASTFPTHVCVCVMSPLYKKALTETELNGGIDGPDCPNLKDLVDEWRNAFRLISHGHTLRHLQFDMRTPQKMELRHIVRLLQTLSTTVEIKAAPRHVIFSIRGCSEEEQKYLERGLPSHNTIPNDS